MVPAGDRRLYGWCIDYRIRGLRKSIAKRAHELGIPFAEAWEFARGLAYELVDLTFAKGQHDQSERPNRAASRKDAACGVAPITGNVFIDAFLRRAAAIVAIYDALTEGADSELNGR